MCIFALKSYTFRSKANLVKDALVSGEATSVGTGGETSLGSGSSTTVLQPVPSIVTRSSAKRKNVEVSRSLAHSHTTTVNTNTFRSSLHQGQNLYVASPVKRQTRQVKVTAPPMLDALVAGQRGAAMGLQSQIVDLEQQVGTLKRTNEELRLNLARQEELQLQAIQLVSAETEMKQQAIVEVETLRRE